MAKNVQHVSHIKSKQIINGKPKLPDSSLLVEGEIAINFAEGVETISTKNESGNVVTFSSDNYYTEQKLGSGFTDENSGRTVTEALDEKVNVADVISAITPSNSGSTNPIATSVVAENEKVVTNALINLDDKISDLSGQSETVAAALNSLDSALNGLDSALNSLDSALNSLDSRKLDVSAYTPTDFVQKRDGDMLYEKDGIYQIKDNSVYPVSHPDLSTQPSVLPQRFGNLDIKEILIPLGGGNEWDVSKNIPSDSLIIECSLFSNDAFASPLMRKKDGKWYLGIGNVYTDIEPKEWWALVRYVGADNGYYGYYGGQGEEITVIDDTDDGTLVDLGLPSSTLWAKSNLGATKPSEYGLYFQWGDTQGYTADQVGSGEGQKYFGWADYKYGNGGSSATDMTKYNATDHLVTLEASDDAVYVATNGAMKMPTATQMEELYQYTDVSWIKTQNGVYGRKFTNKSDSSKYIFFPAAGLCNNGSVYYVGSYGFYWSSSLDTSNVIYGRSLSFYSGNCSMYSNYRYYGFAVRGVVG